MFLEIFVTLAVICAARACRAGHIDRKELSSALRQMRHEVAANRQHCALLYEPVQRVM
jgi:hypothetical protein